MSVDRSAFYNSFVGTNKNKFNAAGPKADDVKEQALFKWTSNNMYRTSYHDMAKKV